MTTTVRKVFYTLCFGFMIHTEVRVYQDFEEYIYDLTNLLKTIRTGSIDTFKLRAASGEEALQEAKQHYKKDGWKID